MYLRAFNAEILRLDGWLTKRFLPLSSKHSLVIQRPVQLDSLEHRILAVIFCCREKFHRQYACQAQGIWKRGRCCQIRQNINYLDAWTGDTKRHR